MDAVCLGSADDARVVVDEGGDAARLHDRDERLGDPLQRRRRGGDDERGDVATRQRLVKHGRERGSVYVERRHQTEATAARFRFGHGTLRRPFILLPTARPRTRSKAPAG